MKKLFTLAVILFSASILQAQNLNINFDNYNSPTDNDLVNNFIYFTDFTQSTSGGITGGCVLTNGQDLPVYKTTDSFPGNEVTVSISFFYDASKDSADGNTNGGGSDENYSGGAMIELLSSPTSYPSFAIAYAQRLYGVPNFWIHAFGEDHNVAINQNDWVTNHWYKVTLTASLASNNNAINTSGYLYDLGAAGTATPRLIASLTNEHDPLYNNEIPLIQRGFNGSRRAGCVKLDNFSSTIGTTTGIAAQTIQKHFTMPTVVTTSLPVTCSLDNEVNYAIYSMAGTVVQQGSFTKTTNININNIPVANYMIRLISDNQATAKIFVKQ